MAIIGMYTLANFTSFGEEQKLKSAASDIQSLLRLAQTNSTTGLKCQNETALGWLVEIQSNTTLNLKCINGAGTTGPLKTLTLSGQILIDTITYSGTPCPYPTNFTFAPLYGTVSTDCVSPLSTIKITLKNNKLPPAISSSVNVQSGGRVYLE